MIARCWSVAMATQGNVGVGQNIREMTALGGAILFEIYRQGIAAG